MVRKGSEPHQHSFFVLECRNPIADGFRGLGWHSGPNRLAKLRKGVAAGLRDTSKVFRNVLRSDIALRRRAAITRFQVFHAGDAIRTLASSPCPEHRKGRSK